MQMPLHGGKLFAWPVNMLHVLPAEPVWLVSQAADAIRRLLLGRRVSALSCPPFIAPNIKHVRAFCVNAPDRWPVPTTPTHTHTYLQAELEKICGMIGTPGKGITACDEGVPPSLTPFVSAAAARLLGNLQQ